MPYIWIYLVKTIVNLLNWTIKNFRGLHQGFTNFQQEKEAYMVGVCSICKVASTGTFWVLNHFWSHCRWYVWETLQNVSMIFNAFPIKAINLGISSDIYIKMQWHYSKLHITSTCKLFIDALVLQFWKELNNLKVSPFS